MVGRRPKRGELTERVETRISKSLRRRLEAEARRVDRSQGSVLRRALEAYLEKKTA